MYWIARRKENKEKYIKPALLRLLGYTSWTLCDPYVMPVKVIFNATHTRFFSHQLPLYHCISEDPPPYCDYYHSSAPSCFSHKSLSQPSLSLSLTLSLSLPPIFPYWHWPSRLELQNTQTASLQRGKTPPINVLDMTLSNLMVRLQ